MSSQRFIKGKLIPVFDINNYDEDDCIVKNGKTYFIEKEVDEYDYEPCDITMLEDEDGIIEFKANFYDGGTCVEELIDEDFDKRYKIKKQ